MKLALAGAGMTGVSFYRPLRNRGVEVELFEREPGLRCGLTPCAWDDPAGYRQTVLEEFAWMEEERGVLDCLSNGRWVGLRQARVLHRNSRRMGMPVGLRDALSLLKNLS